MPTLFLMLAVAVAILPEHKDSTAVVKAIFAAMFVLLAGLKLVANEVVAAIRQTHPKPKPEGRR